MITLEKILLADWTKCTGCRTCTFVCSFFHEGIFSPSVSRVRIAKQEEKGINIPIVCEHCEKPPCVAACPEGALKIGENGIVKYLRELCKFHQACVEACPYDYLMVARLKGEKKLLKCDLCDGDPQCVKYCTSEALLWVERNPDTEAKKSALTKNRTRKLREVV